MGIQTHSVVITSGSMNVHGMHVMLPTLRLAYNLPKVRHARRDVIPEIPSRTYGWFEGIHTRNREEERSTMVATISINARGIASHSSP